MKMQISPEQYKYEVMLCFWFAIHKQMKLEYELLYTLDPICEQIMKNLREQGEEALERRRMMKDKRNNKGNLFSIVNVSGSKDYSAVN